MPMLPEPRPDRFNPHVYCAACALWVTLKPPAYRCPQCHGMDLHESEPSVPAWASDWTDTGVLRVVKAHRGAEQRCVDTVLQIVFGPVTDADSEKSACNGNGTCGTLTRTR